MAILMMKKERTPYRNRNGFQGSALFDSMTVAESVAFP
jgi:ABC-type transporter Mla maintaining outer membrane lipid asymmetry ATPase subunit MlaF